jgi:transposase-like protein
LGGRGRWISEFEASLIYRVGSRTARATQRNPVSKNQKKKIGKEIRIEIYLVSNRHLLNCFKEFVDRLLKQLVEFLETLKLLL